jgi:hypothetical protein
VNDQSSDSSGSKPETSGLQVDRAADNRSHADISLRAYSEEQLADFLEADRLDDEARALLEASVERA